MCALALFMGIGACKKYLDVVPDGVATIENAFTLRSSAERYLATCYSYLPDNGTFKGNPGFSSGDEIWYMNPPKDIDVTTNYWEVARGNQNVNSPFINYWEGLRGGKPLFQAIRNCNIFLENIHKVPDMDEYEKDRWKMEVTFLKAYFHFLMVRSYGPVPLMKTNLPIETDRETAQVYRDPLDDCWNYIYSLIDEVIASDRIPDRIDGTEAAELGRITKAIVYAVKAKIAVTAASPLFNGNPDYLGLKDNRGTQLFPAYSAEKWTKAVEACRSSIEFLHTNGYALYKYLTNDPLDPVLKVRYDLRGAITDRENENKEVIWHNTGSMATTDMQRFAMCNIRTVLAGNGPKGILAPPIKMAEMFYTKNGVPIDQDITWPYANKLQLRKAVAAERMYIGTNEEVTELHYDREPRFYSSLAFDRGTWYGNWEENYNQANISFIKARRGEAAARAGISNYSVTGYWPKKLVAIETTVAKEGSGATWVAYPWPEIRLADLYLLYAEALNEVNGPTAEVYEYINKVRERAGIPTVQDAWSNFARENAKHTNKEGLRQIIHQERAVELAFEGQRIWDLKRWKTAHLEINGPVKGWDIEQKDAPAYYKEVILFFQSFNMREYLTPISVNELLLNKNLVQNPGW